MMSSLFASTSIATSNATRPVPIQDTTITIIITAAIATAAANPATHPPADAHPSNTTADPTAIRLPAEQIRQHAHNSTPLNTI